MQIDVLICSLLLHANSAGLLLHTRFGISCLEINWLRVRGARMRAERRGLKWSKAEWPDAAS